MNASEDVAWEGPVRSFGRRASGPTVQRIVLGAQLRRLREARDGHKSLTGELVGASDQEVTLAAGEGVVSIPYELIDRSNLVPGD